MDNEELKRGRRKYVPKRGSSRVKADNYRDVVGVVWLGTNSGATNEGLGNV